MRVLYVTNIPAPYKVEFLNELAKLCKLHVLFERKNAGDRHSLWGKENKFMFNYTFMNGIKWGSDASLSFEIISFLKQEWDIIIMAVYHTPTAMIGIEYLKLCKIPFILSTDGGIVKEEFSFKAKIKRHFISAASAWLSTGNITNQYLEYYGAQSDKIYIYPFTSIKKRDVLKKSLNKNEKEVIREKLSINEEIVILSVGQFIHRKGYDTLLNASKNLDENVGIYIIGGQPTEEYLQLKEKLSINKIYFLDFMSKDSLAEYYKAADFFVLPTREDIWGLVINEALAYGLPVITTNKCVAGLEMIKNKEIGLIINSDSTTELENAIKSAIKMNFNTNKILEVANKYTIESMAMQHYLIIEHLYKEMIK